MAYAHELVSTGQHANQLRADSRCANAFQHNILAMGEPNVQRNGELRKQKCLVRLHGERHSVRLPVRRDSEHHRLPRTPKALCIAHQGNGRRETHSYELNLHFLRHFYRWLFERLSYAADGAEDGHRHI